MFKDMICRGENRFILEIFCITQNIYRHFGHKKGKSLEKQSYFVYNFFIFMFKYVILLLNNNRTNIM